MKADQLLKNRDDEYGPAWLSTSKIAFVILFKETSTLVGLAPQFMFAWIMILNKLIRACKTPHNPDHWLDIIGYATLVYNQITGEKDGKTSSS